MSIKAMEMEPGRSASSSMPRFGESFEATTGDVLLDVEQSLGGERTSAESAREVAQSGAPKTERVYYLDWMRIVAIWLVVAYHVVQCLNWVGFFGNDESFQKFNTSFMASSLQIGMPMFFSISGRAQALTSLASFQTVLWNRFLRLILPFVVCYIFLIPPWQYIDMEYDWGKPGIQHMKANFVTWIFKYWFSGKWTTHFDLGWLWFLPVLFAITVLSTPLIVFSEKLGERWQGDRFNILDGVLLLAAVTLLASFNMCVGFTFVFSFFSVLGMLVSASFAFLVPLPPHVKGASTESNVENSEGWARRQFIAWLATKSLYIISTLGIVCYFGYEVIDPPGKNGHSAGTDGHSPAAAVPFINLCFIFYIDGYFEERRSKAAFCYFKNIIRKGSPLRQCIAQIFVVFTGFLLILIVTLSSPYGDVESEHYIYPIYSNTYKNGPGWGAAHILGTWTYIALFIALFAAYSDFVISPMFYKHAAGSCIVVYIFHWVWLKMLCFWIIRPNLKFFQDNWTVGSALLVMAFIFLAVGVCNLGVYWVLLKVPMLGRLFGL